MKKIIIIGARPRSLINFRGELIKLFIKKGYKVTAIAAEENPVISNKLQSIGATYKSIPIKRNGFNPLDDLKTCLSFRKYFNKTQPNIILAYTVKPIIWGGLASSVLPNVKFFALITGLGFAFQGDSIKRKILSILVTFLYKIALRNSKKVFFQNGDNMKQFIEQKIVSEHKCEVINGSGVDTDYFTFSSIPNNDPVFLTIGRLLGEKGFREYSQAAKLVKDKYPKAIFQLLGHEDSSPDHIPINEVQEWHDKGVIEYLGSTDDVRPFLRKCHTYVLASYHEGMPRSVLEAMSIGRPILTTDVPGCRETVEAGRNGFLVPKADAEALAESMIWFIENPELLSKMGRVSRELAIEKYDVHKINSQIIKSMEL